MFERFTDRARKVMALANQEAQRLNRDCIESEHILLGLLREGSGVGATVLKNLDVDFAKVRAETEKLIQAGTDTPPAAKLPPSTGAKKVIQYGIEEARKLGHNYAGTEHFLLGLLREEEGIAAKVLTSLGVTFETAREEVLNLIGMGVELDQNAAVAGKSSMFEKFTDRARKVMALANQEAQRFNHAYIGTEHILLGLMKEGTGAGAVTLKKHDIDLRKVRLETEKLVKSGPDVATMSKLPRTPRANKAIEFAIEESRILGHNFVGTEHLLLGLLREKYGVAAQVLLNLGLRLDELRAEVVAMVTNGQPEALWYSSSPAPPAMPINDRLSKRAREVIRLATEEARGFNHEFVGTEHFLLGWAQEAAASDPEFLQALQLDAASLRAELEKTIRRGPMAIVGELMMTPQAKTLIRAAILETHRHGAWKVESELLLLGLMRDGTPTCDLLVRMKLDVPRMRELALARLMVQLAKPPSEIQPKDALVADASAKHALQLSAGRFFLSLVQEPDGLIRQALLNRGVDPADIEREVRRLMGEAAQSADEPPEGGTPNPSA